MTTARQFFDQIDNYNNRVHEVAQHMQALKALQEEREILRAQASDYMRLSQFDAEIATFIMPKFTFPEGYKPPQVEAPAEPAKPDDGAPIIRHGEQAAE